MALHHTISSDKTSCGRTATAANATSNTADVTCKTCCKSEAFISAATVATMAPVAMGAPATTTKPASTAPTIKAKPIANAVPATRRAGVAFEEWRSQLSSKDRLPRGKFAHQRKRRDPARTLAAA